jgi:hypothetical protein
MPTSDIREVARLIKENYDKISNKDKTIKDAEIVQAGLNTCLRNALGMDPRMVDDIILNTYDLNNMEQGSSSETEKKKDKDKDKNKKVTKFCKALDLENINEASIDVIRAAQKALDLDSPKQLDNYGLTGTIATWLVMAIKSKFELTTQTPEDKLIYEKDVKEVDGMIKEITFHSPVFKGKEKESYASKYIQGILEEASEMVAKIPLLSGYEKHILNNKVSSENKSEEELKQENVNGAVQSSSTTPKKLTV